MELLGSKLEIISKENAELQKNVKDLDEYRYKYIYLLYITIDITIFNQLKEKCNNNQLLFLKLQIKINLLK